MPLMKSIINFCRGVIRILLAHVYVTLFFCTVVCGTSEILGIPVSLESGTATDTVDFYDFKSSLGYGTSYDYEALRRGNEAKDCRLVNKVDDLGNYQSCAHVLTEVWYGQAEQTNFLWNEGVIERPGVMGALGFQSTFIPRFTAEDDASLLTHLGLKGEENRQKLADTFLRPTSWGEYCALVSDNNCTSADATAQRAPDNDEEFSRYFVEDVFNGFFRRTDQNNCTLNPTTCTGHVVDYREFSFDLLYQFCSDVPA